MLSLAFKASDKEPNHLLQGITGLFTEEFYFGLLCTTGYCPSTLDVPLVFKSGDILFFSVNKNKTNKELILLKKVLSVFPKSELVYSSVPPLLI